MNNDRSLILNGKESDDEMINVTNQKLQNEFEGFGIIIEHHGK